MREARLAQIRALPPNLTILQVSQRLNLPLTLARPLMRMSGYAFRTAYARQKVWPEQWQNVDWSLTNQQIAELLGLSRERVRIVREFLGIAKVRRYRRKKSQPVLPVSGKAGNGTGEHRAAGR